jgi:bisphosphoglycerate-dependent phosphoglycerate mutase
MDGRRCPRHMEKHYGALQGAAKAAKIRGDGGTGLGGL